MIVVEHVTKYYGARPAVRDLDFKIADGECVGFLGLNGAGKTTTLRLLSCLLLPSSGRVTIRGIDAEVEPHEIRKFIGFLPDNPPLYPEMPVAEYVRFAGLLRQMTKTAVAKRLPEVMATCGLEHVASEPIGTLSHGYRQRVGIAQAIVHDPALLILDEPIQGLDPVQIVEMREMIRSLRGKHTILLSTHILSEIEQTCDRILMLHEGRIAAQGTEDELVARFGEGVVAELEVRGDQTSIRRALGSLSEVDHHELSDGGDGIVRVRVFGRGDPRESVSRAIIQSGLGLRSLGQISSGLERIFVNLSRHEPSGSSIEKTESKLEERISHHPS